MAPGTFESSITPTCDRNGYKPADHEGGLHTLERREGEQKRYGYSSKQYDQLSAT
jgi:hypothetical protein